MTPCKKEKHHQGGVERDKVASRMERVVDEDGVANNANAPHRLKERNEKSAAPASQFPAQAGGKCQQEQAEHQEVSALSQAQRCELQRADGVAGRVIARSKQAEGYKNGDEDNSGETRGEKKSLQG